MVRRRWIEPVRPAERDTRDGLAYTLWLPEGPARGAIVVLHGADSCKEAHHPFCRAALAAGFAALAYDARGHGESPGRLDSRALEDVAAMTELLREKLPGRPPVALRGSSMGGYLAIVTAAQTPVEAVVAICPAQSEGLRRGLLTGRFGFAADLAALERLLAEHELGDAVRGLRAPLLIMHAEGDEVVPVQGSRELETEFSSPASRLIVVPGGHHRSVQHDEEFQAVSLRWLTRVFGGR